MAEQTYLVTGLGFIGSYLAHALSSEGNKVIAIYRQNAPLSNVKQSPNLTLIRDEDADYLKELKKIDYIIHTAAVHPNSKTKPTIDEYIKCNISFTNQLAELASRLQPKAFVYLSSISIYGNVSVAKLDSESSIKDPTLYGVTKYCGERIIETFKDLFPSICIRLPGVVGPNAQPIWINKILTSALKGSEITIYNSDAPFNNIVHLSELKRFILHLANRGLASFNVTNIAASHPLSIGEATSLVLSLTNSKSKVVDAGNNKQHFMIDIEELKSKFDFLPISTEENIKRFVKDQTEIS